MKKNKKHHLMIIISLFIVVLFVNFLLPYNYPTDIYNIYVMGYKEYANTWFITSGRTICLIVYYLLDILNIPLNIGIFTMKIISIIISTSCIYIFYNIISSSITIKNKIQKIGLFTATLLIFLNNSTYEFFYYTESAVMWLGVLFVVLALKVYNNNSKYKYLKIFIYLFLSLNCYQSIILLYIPALILLKTIKKEPIHKNIKELLYNMLIVFINIVLGFIIVKVIRYYNTFVPFKKLDLSINLYSIIYYTKKILFYFGSIFPNRIITFIDIFILLSLSIESYYKQIDKQHIIYIFLIILISFIEVLLYVIVPNFYVADRINYAYIASTGIILIYSLIISNNKILYTGIAIMLLVLQILSSFEITYYSQKTRKTDDVYGARVNKLIEKYEQDNNIKIKKIVYCHDDDPTITYKGYKKSSEQTCRGFYGEWIIKSIFNYYNQGHDFDAVYNQNIYKEKFKSQNWDDFSEEQFIFENDTLYYCVY